MDKLLHWLKITVHNLNTTMYVRDIENFMEGLMSKVTTAWSTNLATQLVPSLLVNTVRVRG